jgi:hypothetical protein
MSRRRTTTRCARAAGAAGVVAATALLGAPGFAPAAFTPPRLVSGATALAADFAYAPAISADGRYVVFTGSQAGVTGVFRKDLQTNALELVAGGDAGAPSISADGRFVALTTRSALDPANDTDRCGDVYVRDMTVPAGAGAYALASARDGSARGLTYSDAADASCGGGSDAATRTAISADGTRVAFTTLSDSDLTSAAGDPSTPALQVAVRDLATRRTTLVSQTRASLGGMPAPVPNGAALARGASPQAKAGASRSTASISADGSTVAWMGIDVPAQTAVADGSVPGDGTPGNESEPLWRRLADGPSAPTRRVVGGDDPATCPGCVAPLSLGFGGSNPTPGPYEFGTYLGGMMRDAPFVAAVDQLTPQLSADGRKVALLSTQPTPAEALAVQGQDPTANACVVDMSPGLTRAEALTRITAWASTSFVPATAPSTAAVTSIAISPDGTRVAFTTSRIAFPLSPPVLVTPPLSQSVADELYQADLSAGTLALVSTGYDGAPANQATFAPAYAGDSRTVAFASLASNLVYGAVNGVQNSAVFTTSEVATPIVPGVPTISPRPAPLASLPQWRLGATVRRGPSGSVYVDVTIPGAGKLDARAGADVPILVRLPAKRTAHRGHAAAIHGKSKRARKAPVRSTTTTTRIVRRTVASERASSRAAGRVLLRLVPTRAYRALTGTRDGLDAAITVTFTAPHRPSLRATLVATFRAPAKPKPTKPTKPKVKR